MRRTNSLPELLAPAGNMECLCAAVKAGADAVYVGAKSFNARAYAGNFDIDELRCAVEYCHLYGIKLYVTLNTLLFDKELSDALTLVGQLYEIGVDALIVADLGLVRLVRSAYPDFELHASTQMSVNSTQGADAAVALGCTRVVLARELSRDNIASVVDNSSALCEVFLHGALCVCHSGQCLFSSLVGGRSGNRGECAQPCRLPYNGGRYPLSLSDLSLAAHIRELVELGVDSLKIEGRMKSADYVYTVTSIYRRLLDECRPASAKEVERLEKIFSRGGFTDGYFCGRHGAKMTGVRSEEDKRATKTVEKESFDIERLSISAKLSIRENKPACLSFTLLEGALKGKTVSVYGDTPSSARTSMLTEEQVAQRIQKLGGSLVKLDRSNLEIELDGGLNLSPAALNSLRRACTEALVSAKRERDSEKSERRVAELLGEAKSAAIARGARGRSAYFLDPHLFEGLKSKGALSHFDICFVPVWRIDEIEAVPEGISLPPVITDGELEKIEAMLKNAKARGVKYALVGNIGYIEVARRNGLVPLGDFRLNVFNRVSALVVEKELGVEPMLSCELNSYAVKSLGGREIVYGRIPLMITERCFMKENFGCDKCSRCALCDRKGVKFPMVREWEHRNLILNSAPTFVADKLDELGLRGRVSEHYLFTTESVEEARGIIDAYSSRRAYPFGGPYRRLGKRDAPKAKD